MAVFYLNLFIYSPKKYQSKVTIYVLTNCYLSVICLQCLDAQLGPPQDSRPNSLCHQPMTNQSLTSITKKRNPSQNVKRVLDQHLVISLSRKRYGTRSNKACFGQDLLGVDSQKAIQTLSSSVLQMGWRSSAWN